MPRSQHDRPQANRVFTNREQPIAHFNAARARFDPGQHQVLVFYGVGGQGKTALRKHLARILADEDPRRAVWGVLDCEVFSDAARGLLELRKTLRDSGPVRCTAFDVAIATYWEKAYPTEDIAKALKDLLNDHEGVLGSIADNAPSWLELAKDLPAGLGLGVKALLLARKKYKDSAARRSVEALQGIEQLDATELLAKLPYFLAVDLRAQDTRRPVLFLDTYEALWSDQPDKTGLAAVETDAWVRELVAAAPGVLFVVLGRDKLSWPQRFPADGWGACLEQHLLGGLSEPDADRFLRQIPVDEPAIRAAMIDAAQGAPLPAEEGFKVGAETFEPVAAPGAHPFYLDLAVDHYLDLKAEGQTPQPAQFKGTHTQIIARFLRHRNAAEQATLKLLSGPRAFDRELFEALIGQFQTGYPATAWDEFLGFSFIETGPDGLQRLHGLMREHLRASLDAATRVKLQAFLFDWFDAHCQAEAPKDLNRRHEWALREAVYHRDVADIGEALAWFWQRQRMFYDAARYAAIEPLNRWALALAENRLGAGNPETAIALNNLAQLLKETNRLADAEPSMRRALEIVEASYGTGHPNVAAALNNLAQLLQDTNRLADAEPLMRRALEIDERSLGPQHPAVARDLDNLAQLLKDTNRLAEAEPLMRRALEIDERSFGPQHPNVAIRLNNLASLLQDTNRLADAEPLMRRALAIDEQGYGPQHPAVARDLNNLATLMYDTNRLADAEPLLRRVVEIFEASHGTGHPNVAAALNNLASLLQATNRLAEAEPLMRRALEINEQSYGPQHPDVAAALNNLASLLQATNRLAEAEPLMRRALVIVLQFTEATGHEHPHLRDAFRNYLRLLEALPPAEADLIQALISLGAEAGWDADEWQGWLRQRAAGGA